MGHLNPACLPPGTRVGRWRVVDPRGWGAFGTVYLAVAAEPPATGEVALKLARHSGDERFAREVELLSRVRHPAVPRLLDHGQWQSPEGVSHPFIVMEWVEGLPLYEWARVNAPTSRQVLQLLAGLARALEVIHSAQGVHRDVKGDNVLVRLTDGLPFLVDFGSSSYRGAAPLTAQVFPPGTSLYRSPEAYRHALRRGRKSATPYAPGPADDVFALGVTAYRLVTQEYPPSPDPMAEEAHRWHVEGVGPQPARGLNAWCCAELSALIARMLSIRPEQRGGAGELAEALEEAMRNAGDEADAPLFLRKATLPPEKEGTASQSPPPVPGPERRTWVAVSALAAVLVWVAGVEIGARTERWSSEEQAVGLGKGRDAGTVAMGESVMAVSATPIHGPVVWPGISVDMPKRPFPGQTRPDANGQCTRKVQVAINGGCWWKLEGEDKKDCGADAYLYKGVCYEPVFRRPPPSMSGSTETPDGG